MLLQSDIGLNTMRRFLFVTSAQEVDDDEEAASEAEQKGDGHGGINPVVDGASGYNSRILRKYCDHIMWSMTVNFN
ncbi:MAG: hypothetical protein LV481_16305 [Methylacidiphilales bacterium]|nr:hypothetical protein [Candidatus Methylacidiphilales bacterium]